MQKSVDIRSPDEELIKKRIISKLGELMPKCYLTEPAKKEIGLLRLIKTEKKATDDVPSLESFVSHTA